VEADRNAPVYGTGEIEATADPETVWAVLADIQGWPTWNPDIAEASLRGPVRPGTTFSWKSGPGTITSTFHVYRLRPSERHPGHTILTTEESWGGLLARLLRKRFATTLKTAIDTGLARLKAEAERRATP
jgi:hypothetical protein